MVILEKKEIQMLNSINFLGGRFLILILMSSHDYHMDFYNAWNISLIDYPDIGHCIGFSFLSTLFVFRKDSNTFVQQTIEIFSAVLATKIFPLHN